MIFRKCKLFASLNSCFSYCECSSSLLIVKLTGISWHSQDVCSHKKEPEIDSLQCVFEKLDRLADPSSVKKWICRIEMSQFWLVPPDFARILNQSDFDPCSYKRRSWRKRICFELKENEKAVVEVCWGNRICCKKNNLYTRTTIHEPGVRLKKILWG